MHFALCINQVPELYNLQTKLLNIVWKLNTEHTIKLLVENLSEVIAGNSNKMLMGYTFICCLSATPSQWTVDSLKHYSLTGQYTPVDPLLMLLPNTSYNAYIPVN